MDTLTKEERSERMSCVRSTNTSPELVVRRMLHGLGYRYRLHSKGVPGRPDICFKAKRKAVFVHGCFWHRHDPQHCKLTRLPKSRVDFWETKLEANRVRDTKTLRALEDQGWSVLIVWECELAKPDVVRDKLVRFLGMRGNASD